MEHTRSRSAQDASEKRPISEVKTPSYTDFGDLTDELVMILLQGLSAHDSSLSSHLQLIESLKADLTSQKISQILDSAQKLVDEFAKLKTQLVSYGHLAINETIY